MQSMHARGAQAGFSVKLLTLKTLHKPQVMFFPYLSFKKKKVNLYAFWQIAKRKIKAL